MAFTVFQAGSTLYGMDPRGETVALTLPTGVTLDDTLRPRFTVFNNYAIMVNSPSRPIIVDANLNVRVLSPQAPSSPMTAAAGAAGGLIGDYSARQTFVVFDAFGALISESDFGPTSNTVTLASQMLNVSGVNLSTDTVSGTRLYRTTAGTSVYFQWLDMNGNTQTTIEDDLSDAGLSTLSAPALGTAPNMSLISEFRSRVFGVSKFDPNSIRYSEIGAMYAWPSDNTQPVPRLGSDSRGVTGFVRKRDALGIGRSNGFYQFTGTDDSSFRIVNISENCGIEAPDSVAVYKDVGFFLWKDGVYRWDTAGVQNVSDEKVSRWFTTNDTFNLARLQYAFGIIDPFRKRYKLYLASAGSRVEDCWIEYDFQNNRWWGPHMSHAFHPTSAFYMCSDSGLFVPLVGASDGYVRRDRRRRTDDSATGIDFDVVTNRDAVKSPSTEKVFGRLFVEGAVQESGELTVQTTVGGLDALRTEKPSNTTLESSYDMTKGYQDLGRIGQGQAYKVRFRNNQPGEDVNIRGYEIDPVFPVGRR